MLQDFGNIFISGKYQYINVNSVIGIIIALLNIVLNLLNCWQQNMYFFSERRFGSILAGSGIFLFPNFPHDRLIELESVTKSDTWLGWGGISKEAFNNPPQNWILFKASYECPVYPNGVQYVLRPPIFGNNNIFYAPFPNSIKKVAKQKTALFEGERNEEQWGRSGGWVCQVVR